MGVVTEISWTDHTFNPWWGCTRVSPGCGGGTPHLPGTGGCYAEAFAKRTGLGWGPSAERRFFGEKHWRGPLKWNAAAERERVRKRVFCASMADVFEDRRDLDLERAKLWKLIEETPWLDWQFLTKRPENMRRMLPLAWIDDPLPSVWLGTTAEDQKRADERIPHLLATPAVVRFISAEPLLGPVDISKWLEVGHRIPSQGINPGCWRCAETCEGCRPLDWVIVGSESGHGARAMDTAWARRIVDDCLAAGVAVFTKQIASDRARLMKDPKGGDTQYWPPGKWPRQFPGMSA